MIRISSLSKIKRSTPTIYLVSLALLVPVLLAACADVSPAIGKYYMGRTLHISVVSMERVPELRYSLHVDQTAQTGPKHYRLAPSESDQELIMLRLKVENHTATSAIVNVDQRAAELRDFFQGKYFPIDITERAEEIAPPEDIDDIRLARCPMQYPDDICFLWNKTVADGSTRSFDLQKGFGVDGWMIFEAPKDTEIRDLRWRAGDGITINF